MLRRFKSFIDKMRQQYFHGSKLGFQLNVISKLSNTLSNISDGIFLRKTLMTEYYTTEYDTKYRININN